MFNLLPKKQKKDINSEYRVRWFSAVFIAVFFLQLTALATLFPSYVFSVLNHRELSSSLESLKVTEAFLSGEELNERIQNINQKTEILVSQSSEFFIREIVESLLEQENENIRIRRILFDSGSEGEFKIALSGEAETREALVSFAERLESKERFQAVEVPVSDLAQRFNITFSLDITGEI